jgi:hypothetical protein
MNIFTVPAGRPVGESVAKYFTSRNRGIREPEFRLPAIAISLITAPLGLSRCGIGLQKMSFRIPVPGLGLSMFSLVALMGNYLFGHSVSFSGGQAINISFVPCLPVSLALIKSLIRTNGLLDAYSPVSGGATITQLAFKCTSSPSPVLLPLF